MRTKKSVEEFQRRYDETPPYRRRMVMSMYQDGSTLKDIMRAYGLPEWTVKAVICTELGTGTAMPHFGGHHTTKHAKAPDDGAAFNPPQRSTIDPALTGPDRDDRIRALVAAGSTFADVARKSGISYQRVQQICARRPVTA